jgi:hypothetical protein
MLVEDGDSRYAKNLWRNLLIGLVSAFVATTALCFAAVGRLGVAAAVASVPALFAGPYIGLLITLVSATASDHASGPPAAPATSPAVSDIAA